MSNTLPRTVMVTGATGNLGQKTVEALAQTPWCERVIGVDRSCDESKFSARARGRLQLVAGDLTKREGAWTDAMRGVDAVVHFAASNPVPDSTWLDAMDSYEMVTNVALECARAGVGRFVFASSNHVMGGYKDEPLAQRIGPGRLTTDLPVAPGTRWFDGKREVHSLAYGTAKVMGEKFCAAASELSGGRLATVAVRVGWALTGDNAPRDITYSGSPASTSDMASLDANAWRALRWFRSMWLSNRDLAQLFTAAVTAPDDAWPARSIIVNGVSDNRDMAWSLERARECLGYAPQDDVYRHVESDVA
jgi:nucleoside-diphosphate-sugar epimerase